MTNRQMREGEDASDVVDRRGTLNSLSATGDWGIMRLTPLPPDLAMLLRIPAATRAYLETVAEAAIDALDQLDGDTDLEDDPDRCTAGDDGCGLFVVPWRGSAWGSDAHDDDAEDWHQPVALN